MKMKNRIQHLFESKKKNILSIYFTAGFPNLDDTLEIIKNLSDAGVDMIEIGMPFSDPLADGPTIQQSNTLAIANGMTIPVLLEQLKHVRKITNIPLVLMGYLNPILQFGEMKFIETLNTIGIDGVIIPDMPLDYYENHLKLAMEEKNIATILLIAPTTSNERIRKIDDIANGFIYMVSSNGITGSNKNMNLQQDYFNRVKTLKLKNPTVIGFGIHDKQSVNEAFENSNGAIIGSAFVKTIKTSGTSPGTIQHFIKALQ
jgi:tryptophan synthase alpha chain